MSSAKLVHRTVSAQVDRAVVQRASACRPRTASPIPRRTVPRAARLRGSGNTLTIHQLCQRIINWQSFSIGPNEITRFLQSSTPLGVEPRVGQQRRHPAKQARRPASIVLANNPTRCRAGVLLNQAGVIGATAAST